MTTERNTLSLVETEAGDTKLISSVVSVDGCSVEFASGDVFVPPTDEWEQIVFRTNGKISRRLQTFLDFTRTRSDIDELPPIDVIRPSTGRQALASFGLSEAVTRIIVPRERVESNIEAITQTQVVDGSDDRRLGSITLSSEASDSGVTVPLVSSLPEMAYWTNRAEWELKLLTEAVNENDVKFE